MTFVSFNVGTRGAHLELFGIEIQITLAHDGYASPYALFSNWWGRVFINPRSIVVYKSDRCRPPCYTITHTWGKDPRRGHSEADA